MKEFICEVTYSVQHREKRVLTHTFIAKDAVQAVGAMMDRIKKFRAELTYFAVEAVPFDDTP